MLGIDQILLGSQTISVTGNTLYVNGNHANLSTSGIAPITNLLTVPISINLFGSTANLMGTPSGWLSANLSGQAIKIPYWI